MNKTRLKNFTNTNSIYNQKEMIKATMVLLQEYFKNILRKTKKAELYPIYDGRLKEGKGILRSKIS
jgi:hypothetical protein